MKVIMDAEGHANTPAWATADQSKWPLWWYENEFGEIWIARKIDGVLYITGQDIEWAEIRLDKSDARTELQNAGLYIGKCLRRMATGNEPHKISVDDAFAAGGRWIMGYAEVLWYASVLITSYPV